MRSSSGVKHPHASAGEGTAPPWELGSFPLLLDMQGAGPGGKGTPSSTYMFSSPAGEQGHFLI